nr:hypothetical protein [uncultured Blautia sp.]
MNRKLNVCIIQSPMNPDTVESLQYLKEQVKRVMGGYVKPELIIGVEHGLGRQVHRIPSEITDFLGGIKVEIFSKMHLKVVWKLLRMRNLYGCI